MGSAVGAAYAAGGHRVVATVAGRSERTRRSRRGGRGSSSCPIWTRSSPSRRSCSRSCRPTRRPRRPRRSPPPPTAPAPVRSSPTGTPSRRRPPASSSAILADAGLELVDGSISGGPPRADYTTRVYLSGPGAEALAAAAPPWLDARVVGARGRARLGGEDVHRVDVQGLDGAARARAADRARARRAAAGARRPARLLPGPDRPRGPVDRGVDHEGGAVRRRDARDRRDASRRRPDAGALRGDGRGLRRARASPSSPPRRPRTSKARQSSRTCSTASSTLVTAIAGSEATLQGSSRVRNLLLQIPDLRKQNSADAGERT